jgi:hypothetical protein
MSVNVASPIPNTSLSVNSQSLCGPDVFNDLYRFFSQGGTLIEMTWAQHSFHESRRWSAAKMIGAIKLDELSEADKRFIWNAGRAELTTKPGADRLTRTGR